MRLVVLLLTVVLAASPVEAQKKVRRDPYRISTEELVDYGDASLAEVIPKVRPNFLTFGSAGGASIETVQGLGGGAPQIVVFVGTQQVGDSSMLRFYKARDVKEVRYFKPGNSLSPQTAGTAFVIQVMMKDRRDP